MPAAVARTKIRIISAPRDRDLGPDVTHRVQLISHYLAGPTHFIMPTENFSFNRRLIFPLVVSIKLRLSCQESGDMRPKYTGPALRDEARKH